MQIMVKESRPPSALLIFAVAGFTVGGLYFYLFAQMIDPAIVCGVLAVLCLLALIYKTRPAPILVIDDHGVYDRRLGVGKILWRDVEDVQVETSYGNRFLCLKLRYPDKYVARAQGPKKEKLQLNQSIGFRGFNVDIGNLKVSILDLKALIEQRISR